MTLGMGIEPGVLGLGFFFMWEERKFGVIFLCITIELEW